MTRLEKLKSLCANNGITGYVSSLRKSELSALLALVEQMAEAIDRAIIYNENANARLSLTNALTAFAAWNENKEENHD